MRILKKNSWQKPTPVVGLECAVSYIEMHVIVFVRTSSLNDAWTVILMWVKDKTIVLDKIHNTTQIISYTVHYYMNVELQCLSG